jgi:hypothetical protein
MSELICPNCGSDRWESGCSVTLLGGPVNYYTYVCKQCGVSTRVKRVDRSERDGFKIDLGEDDAIVS